MTGQNFEHETVLLNEAVELLVTDVAGVYVDATFGRGGHSQKILERLGPDGRLVAIDKDPEAIKVAEKQFGAESRFTIHHGSFADLRAGFEEIEGQLLSGVLADLGVSSPQLDDAERGFSFAKDGPLDMRMNPKAGKSASEYLDTVEQEELARVLWEYGEEKHSRRIAAAIIAERDRAPIERTSQLAEIVAQANPSWEKHKHPATRSFQAIRIEVNQELEDLSKLLEGAASRLKVGGRLVVISFHSLEDRMVKRFMRDKAKGTEPPPGVPVLESEIVRSFKVSSKAIKPGKNELEHNVRARSAVMRSLEKIADA